ncbi:MAG: hypothetical protein M3N21_00650 [Actinomycetota bacterium]|nr:hypothetical protein [Actinomycetota bacterium]
MTRRQGNIALISVFAVLAIGSMILTGVFDYLLAPDRRVLVVTMAGGGEPARDVVKAACGALPGISVVADQGNPDPQIQGRFPVRFSLRGASFAQEAALEACLQHQRYVRGFLVEGDR